MKKIKVNIRRLGRIQNSEIELTPWMVISGESGMGKSYLATLIHYFFEVLLNDKYINSFITSIDLDYNTKIKDFQESGVAFALPKKELEDWLAQDAIRYVGYMINNKSIKGDIVVQLPSTIPDIMECTYTKDRSGMAEQVDTYIKFTLPNLTYRIKNDPIGINEESPFSFFLRYYLISAIFDDYQALNHAFVLPPSRGAAVTARITPTTGMFEEFLAGKSYLESAKPIVSETAPTLADLLTKILDGKVTIGENHQYRYIMDSAESEDMPLTAAASSVRELAPIQLIIDNVDIRKTVLLFEEPEAHLHPLKQRMMADLICCLSQAGTFMQITTHSDYLLRRINELIKLRRLKQDSPESYIKIKDKVKAIDRILPNNETLTAILLERQEDETSKIVKQNLKSGIPYASFYSSLKDSIDHIGVIVHALEETNHVE